MRTTCTIDLNALPDSATILYGFVVKGYVTYDGRGEPNARPRVEITNVTIAELKARAQTEIITEVDIKAISIPQPQVAG